MAAVLPLFRPFGQTKILRVSPNYVQCLRHRWKYILPKPVYEERKRKYRETVLSPLEETKTLAERLEELNRNPLEGLLVDISLSSSGFVRKISRQDRLQWMKELRSNKEKERQAVDKTLTIDMEDLEKEWCRTEGPSQIQEIADHYGVFGDLFEHAYFTPFVPLQIFYEVDEEIINPVYHGNILPASEVVPQPQVTFPSGPSDMWTLVLTNLDGHLLDTESEYLHWMVGNIKGNDLSTGETICEYIQPFPWKGTGYHRLVFILYKQEKSIDFGSLKRPSPCYCLKERTFRTLDFYRSHQDALTPAGLSFFQCTWDTNLTDFIHNVLQMNEPMFEYNEPPIEHAEQVLVPHLKPFNIYLDRYRDPKEISKEVLLKRLKMIHPFEEEPPMPKFPTLHAPEGRVFSWQKADITNERLRLGKYRGLRPHSAYPQEDNQGKYKYPS